jgi:short-subunit dehydrogenase
MPAESANKKIFLTGASAGIGLAIAQRLSRDNDCEIWGTSRNLSRLPQLPRFHPVEMDLQSPDNIRRAFATAREQSGGFTALINNAGAGAFGPAETMTAEIVRDQFQLLADAPMELIRLALPDMLRNKPSQTRRRGRGRHTGIIINITSLAAVFPIPFMSAYNAAKAALSSHTRCLRLELADTPVRVVEIQPGDINTGFHDATKRFADPRTDGVWRLQQETMRAAPSPDRVAEVVAKTLRQTNPPPVIVVGNFEQSKLAPLAARILPARWMEKILRRHYRL